MSAERKPGEPGEIPAFLRPKSGDPGEIPSFLTEKPAAPAKPPPRPPAAAPVPPDAGRSAAQPSAPPPPPAKPKVDSATAMFDQMVSGIRRDRAMQERQQQEQHSKLDTDWLQVLDSMRQLQRKVQSHANLQYFNISRDNQEVSVKITDHSTNRGFSLYTLARRHPHGKHMALDVVWLMEFPGREQYFHDAKEAMAELVSRIAGALA